MNYLFVFLDTIFGGIFSQDGWFHTLLQKYADKIEQWIYRVEAGGMDVGSFSRTVENIARWLPVVLILCLVADIIIRSRFVRYSYPDEGQAKKSVWWRWQSDDDALMALEEGMHQQALPQQAGADGEAQVEAVQETAPGGEAQVEAVQETAPDGEAQVEAVQETAPDGEAQVEAVQEAGADGEAQVGDAQETAPGGDGVDRGPIRDARQDRLRADTMLAQYLQAKKADAQDFITVTLSAVTFAPKAFVRSVRMTRRNIGTASDRRLRRMRERVAQQQDAAAEAEAFFTQDVAPAYVDAAYDAPDGPVDTGGIRGYSFDTAAQIIAQTMGGDAPQDESAQQTPKQKKPKKKKTRVRIVVGRRGKKCAEFDAQTQEEAQTEPADGDAPQQDAPADGDAQKAE